MKNSDIATIILIASVSVLIAYFVTDSIIGKPANESVRVKTIDAISAEVTEPDTTIFNKDAINPTVEVVIGDQSQTTTPTTTPTQDQSQNQQ